MISVTITPAPSAASSSVPNPNPPNAAQQVVQQVASLSIQEAASASTAAPSVNMADELEKTFSTELDWHSVNPYLKRRLSLSVVLQWLDKCAKDVNYPYLIINCIRYLQEEHPALLQKGPLPLFRLCQRGMESHAIGNLAIKFAGRAKEDRVNSALVALKCPEFENPQMRELILASPVGRETVLFLLQGRVSVTWGNFLDFAELAQKIHCQELTDAVDNWIKEWPIDEVSYQSLFEHAQRLSLKQVLAKISDWLLSWAHPTSPEFGAWPFTSAKMDFLKENRHQINSINFYQVPVDIGLKALDHYPNIQKVTLNPTMTSEQISEAFRKTPHLEVLLANGSQNIALSHLQMLPRATLKVLDLTHCPKFEFEEAIGTLQQFSEMSKLHLGNGKAIKAEALRGLSRLSKLQELEISHTPGFAEGQLWVLIDLPLLMKLCLDVNADLSDEAIAKLERHETLRELSLDGCSKVTDKGLCSLCTLPKLQKVSLRDLPLISAESVRWLMDRPAIQTIDIRGCRNIQWLELYLHPDAARTNIHFDNKEISAIAWSNDLPDLLYKYFVARSSRRRQVQNFYQFPVNGRPYYAYGPKTYFSNFDLREQNPKPFYDALMRAVQPSHVVNLLSDEEAVPYISSEAFKGYFPILEREGGNGEQNIYSNANVTRIMLYHIRKWQDATAPSEDTTQKLLELANNMNQRRKCEKNFRLFVHCRLGLMRSATFIAICELLQKVGEHSDRWSADQYRAFLLRTLEQIQESEKERYPNKEQLKILFSNEFIEKVITLTRRAS